MTAEERALRFNQTIQVLNQTIAEDLRSITAEERALRAPTAAMAEDDPSIHRGACTQRALSPERALRANQMIHGLSQKVASEEVAYMYPYDAATAMTAEEHYALMIDQMVQGLSEEGLQATLCAISDEARAKLTAALKATATTTSTTAEQELSKRAEEWVAMVGEEVLLCGEEGESGGEEGRVGGSGDTHG